MSSTSGRRLRVGLIGTGVGIRTYLPGFAATGRADVVALSGSSAGRAREVAAAAGIPTAYDNYRQLCADPSLDVICVASPNQYHYEHYLAAAASGKHVIVEKPAAHDAEELAKFLEIPTAADQIVLVDHQLRFNPYLRVLRDRIASGELGTPYHLRIHQQGVGLLSPDVPYSWRFDAERGGGVRLAMGSHLVDLVEFLLGGASTDTVFGTLDVVVPTRRDSAGRTHRVSADSAFSSVHRVGDVTALLSASAAAASENLFDVDLLGSAGEAHFSLTDKLRLTTSGGHRTVDRPEGVDPDEVHNRTSVFKSSFVQLARALVSAVLDDQREALAVGSFLHDQMPTARVLDALLESARTGTSVALGEPVRSS
ncbi:Gfo/Idh/MocA family oxidoreductase [Micromonospora sp. NBC_01699]|uniref:Gfo/Idh/MocA family oxidoreductase n=1 Tax=Micromonospora sp. NBC_01699 TaxID=2975984 RepID=UPI002E2B9EA3|nr:Gfo/Idh/MocA family oxidoreductase [Micromonospora sp. NBC_01699]